MLFGMAEALTIPENAFEAVLDCNAYLEPFYTCTCCYTWQKALSSFLALTMPENDFGDVIQCNTYLEAILHLSMLFGMAEALTIPENAFEAVLDFNAQL